MHKNHPNLEKKTW